MKILPLSLWHYHYDYEYEWFSPFCFNLGSHGAF